MVEPHCGQVVGMPPETPTLARCQFAARVGLRIPDQACAGAWTGSQIGIKERRISGLRPMVLFQYTPALGCQGSQCQSDTRANFAILLLS